MIGVLWVLREIEGEEEIRVNKVIGVLWALREIEAIRDLWVREVNMVDMVIGE